MPDPLESPTPDRLSPFASSFSTADTALSLLRDARRNQRGLVGGGPAPLDPLPPSVRVLIRNDAGAALPLFGVVRIGDPLFDIASVDGESPALEFSRFPAFKGLTVAATADQFAILEEPLPYVGGGNDTRLVRAVVQGITVCDVNVTDAAHNYATPTPSDSAKLTSATSGPARILYKPSGTGTKRCVVLVGGLESASSSPTPTFSINELGSSITLTADGVWKSLSAVTPDFTLAAGSYLLFYQATAGGQISAGGPEKVNAHFIANGTVVPGSLTIPTGIAAINQFFQGSSAVIIPTTITTSTDYYLEFQRTNTNFSTWTTVTVASYSSRGYLKLF